MELSTFKNTMQNFLDRLEGLGEEGRSHKLEFIGIHEKLINECGKDYFDYDWGSKTIKDGFEITDEFKIQQIDDEEPQLFIKFTREQTQEFCIKEPKETIIKETKWFFFTKEWSEWSEREFYPVTYTQEYWINAEAISITTEYVGKCN